MTENMISGPKALFAGCKSFIHLRPVGERFDQDLVAVLSARRTDLFRSFDALRKAAQFNFRLAR